LCEVHWHKFMECPTDKDSLRKQIAFAAHGMPKGD
jgi:hypothetical protein